MAANSIKGITVEIGGDTTGLSKALQGVNKDASNLSYSLKTVNSALKLDPSNVTLLTQKQELLSQSVENTKQKLDNLHDAKAQVEKQYQSGNIERDAYIAFQKELVSTESKLKGLQKEQHEFGTVTAQVMAQAGKNVQALGGNISGVGKSMLPATAVITGLGVAAVSAGSNLIESQNKVDVAFKNSAAQVHSFAEKTLDSFGVAKGTALDMAALFGDMATSMNLTTAEAEKMSTALVGRAGDLASFKNIGLDQAQNALKGIFTGETESLKTLGVVMTQANLDSFALAKSYNKTTKEMTEAEKVELRYAYVMEKTANAQGDFANTADGAANSMRVTGEAVKEASASVGVILAPVVANVAQGITSLVKSFISLNDGQKKNIMTIAGIVAAVGPLLLIIGGVITSVGKIITVGSTLFKGITVLGGGIKILFGILAANPIGIIITLIAALVASIVWLWNNCEEFRNGVTAIFSGIVAGFTSFCNFTVNLFTVTIPSAFSFLSTWLSSVFTIDWANSFGVFGNILNAFFTNIENIFNGVKHIFTGVIDFVAGVFSGDWTRAWQGIINIFGGIFDTLTSLAKAPLNGVIGLLNMGIDAINLLIGGLNNIGFNLPQWLGGGSFQINIPSIGKIPFLAQGGTLLNGSAIVGEAGAELLQVFGGKARVLPLSGNAKNEGKGLGAGNISILIKKFINNTPEDGRKLVSRISADLEAEISRKERVFA